MPRWTDRALAKPSDLDHSVVMPYGMHAPGILSAIEDLYSYLQAINQSSVAHGYERLEEIMLPAGFSGLMSELSVRAVSHALNTATPGVTRNMRSGGRPDLIPRAMYPNDAVHRGEQGVEVKCSTSESSWQGHNPETGWIMVIQLTVDRATSPNYDRSPTIVERVLLAQLEEKDWAYSGRGEGSRRTPTASITRAGRDKLGAGAVYQRGRALGVPPAPITLPIEI